MTTARPLPWSKPPAEGWHERGGWEVSSIDEAVAVRDAAGRLVGPDLVPDPGLPVLASISARVETTMGELVANGLRHGRPPVRATISRGDTGWLVMVSDTATGLAPLTGGAPTGRGRGGLGLRLVSATATAAGWYTDEADKHVWALIGDEPPPHLLDTLRRTS